MEVKTITSKEHGFIEAHEDDINEQLKLILRAAKEDRVGDMAELIAELNVFMYHLGRRYEKIEWRRAIDESLKELSVIVI